MPHDTAMSDVTFSPDGTMVATASFDGIAKLWDGHTGEFITATMKLTKGRGNLYRVYDVAFSPDGTMIATAYGYGYTDMDYTNYRSVGEARLWDVQTGAIITTMEHDGSVSRVIFNPDGTSLVTLNDTARSHLRDPPKHILKFWLPNIVGIPELRKPTNGAEVPGVPLTLKWQAIENAIYQVQVANDEQFNQILVEKLTEEEFLSLSFTKPTTYYWRVRTIGFSPDKFGPWSEVGSFIPLPSFDLRSPKNGEWTDGTPSFSYTSGLYDYRLWIDGNLFQDNITQSRYTVTETQALPSGLHTWTIKAVDWAGNTTQANQTWSIRVDGDAPAPFALVEPDDNFWTTAPFLNLAWQASSDAESGLEKYQIFMDDQLFKDNISPTTTTFGPGDNAFDDNFESGASKWNLSGSWDLTVSLRHSGDYALTSNPTGSYNNQQEANVTLVQNIDLAAVESATLKFWHRYALTGEYGSVEISIDGGIKWTKLISYAGFQENWTQVALPIDDYTGSRNTKLRFRLGPGSGGASRGWYIDDIEIVIGDSIPEGEHTWYVVAIDKMGNQTRSEQTRTFQIFIDNTPPETPNLLTPSSGWMTETTPEFSWEPVTDEGIGLAKYQFWLNGELFDDLANQEYEVLGKASGSASHFSLFFFLPLGKADIDAAVRKAIAQRDGDNLINVRYWQRASWALIGAVITIEVEGDVIKYKR